MLKILLKSKHPRARPILEGKNISIPSDNARALKLFATFCSVAFRSVSLQNEIKVLACAIEGVFDFLRDSGVYSDGNEVTGTFGNYFGGCYILMPP